MKTIAAWWGRQFLHAELLLCIFISIIFFLVSSQWGSPNDWPVLCGIRSTLYSTLASIFGSLLGFEITGGAAAFGAIENERFTLIRASLAFPKFWKVFYAAARSTALATIMSLLGLILDKEHTPNSLIFYLVMFTALLATFRVGRSAWLLHYVVRIATRKHPRLE